EMAYVMSSFGVATTLIEAMDRILPLEDAESAAVVARSLSKAGVSIRTGSLASRTSRTDGPPNLSLRSKDGSESALEADRVLVAVGRTPNTDGLGLEDVGVRLERGIVAVGDWMESSASGIYAIGDIVGSPQLAHVASKEGEIAAARIAQVLKGGEEPRERRVDPLLIPSAVYCEPEIGSFGLSEERAKSEGIPFAAARFPYRGIGKAVAIDAVDGQAKLLYDPRTFAVLGASIVGEGATELIHELLLASRSELRIEDVADMIHAHPTLSEGIMEVAKAAMGRAVHA
ncbi:MAG: FAD-dependent oxidoreductase, partial [Spirochaetaceae bacterium]|nr:FAD-dependent oxidoreductase [Spirochaetaceae bacterium]